MKQYIEKAQDYFDRHPSSQECHITSDGRVFHTKGSAQSFAGILQDQDIESHKRSMLNYDVKKNGNEFNEDDERNAKLKELEALELISRNYNAMKVFVKYFDLKTDDQKAETLIAVLTEYKNKLKS